MRGCLRKRDAAALLAAALLVALSLSGRGRPRLERAWTHALAPAARKYDNGAYPRPHERLPPPLVTDLDGDGRREVVLVTREPSLLILAAADDAVVGDGTGGTGGDDDGSAGAGAGAARARRAGKVLARVSLLGLTRSPRGRRPVSLASGFFYPHVAPAAAAAAPASAGSASASSPARKQSIVVVLESWAVLCFDHALRLRWETAANHIESSLGIGALVHREVAAMVSSLSMRSGDTGLVVVGGSMTLRDGVDDGHFELGGMRLQEDTDASDSPDFQAEAELQAKRDIYYAKVARAEHFSYYAFDGATGQLRWKRERGPASSEEDPDADEEDGEDGRQGGGQHRGVSDRRHRGHGHGHGHHHHDPVTTPRGYKTTPDALRHLGRGGAAQPGEYHWRSFRSSVLEQLPHSWTGRDDTRIGLAHFRHDSEGRRAAHWTGGGGGGRNRRAHLLVHPSATSTLHGNVPLSVLASNANEHVFDPNVIVAHTSRGMEVLHAFSGRIVARVGLPEPRYGGGAGAYADLNGDRVIDHVQAIPGLESEAGGAEGEGHQHHGHHHGGDGDGGGGGHKHGGGGRSLGQNHGRSAHFQLPSCWVQTVSGVPPVEQLWNGSLCDPYSYYRASTRGAYATIDAASAGLTRTLLEAGGGAGVGAGPTGQSGGTATGALSDAQRDLTRVSAPTLVRHASSQQAQQQRGARTARRAVVPYDVVVLVSTGVVSCYGPRGQLHWQTAPTAATWHRPDEQFQVVGTSRDVDAFMPSTVVADVEIEEEEALAGVWSRWWWWWGGRQRYHHHPHRHRRVIMATGDSAAVLVDLADGALLSTLPLADPATAKPVVGDFDNDGQNDFVLVTRHAVLGVRIGSTAPSWFAFLGLVVFLVLVAFVATLHCAGLLDFYDEDDGEDDHSGGVRRFEVERFLWKRHRKRKRAMD